jgi:hypothetical protein
VHLVGLRVPADTSHEPPAMLLVNKLCRLQSAECRVESAVQRAPEGNDLLLGDDVLEVLGGAVQRHRLDGLEIVFMNLGKCIFVFRKSYWSVLEILPGLSHECS